VIKQDLLPKILKIQLIINSYVSSNIKENGTHMRRDQKINKRIDYLINTPHKIEKLNYEINDILYGRKENNRRIRAINELKKRIIQKYYHKEKEIKRKFSNMHLKDLFKN